MTTTQRFYNAEPPVAEIIGSIGLLALIANLFLAYFLFKFRPGDANMRSVWLSSRNDAIANVEFICGGDGVWVRLSRWRHHCFVIAMGIGINYQTSNGRA